MIRKRIQENGEEKPVTSKATPSRANTRHAAAKETKTEDKNQIKDKEPIVQVEATDPNHPGFDEKPVTYYRNLGSNSHSSFSSKHGLSSQSKRISKSNKSQKTNPKEGKLDYVRGQFVDLLYQHDEDDITYLWFEHDFISGITKKLAHSKKTYANE